MTAEDDMGEYVTVREAARIAEVSPRTVRRWLDEGRLTKHRLPITQHVRVQRQELEKKTWPNVAKR
jgi:excisionase family DNA binding protein